MKIKNSTNSMGGVTSDKDEVKYDGERSYVYLDGNFLDVGVKCGIYFEINGD